MKAEEQKANDSIGLASCGMAAKPEILMCQILVPQELSNNIRFPDLGTKQTKVD